MTERRFQIEHIPAVLYGDAAEKAYLFVHGQCGCKEEGLAFAEIACPAEYQVLAIGTELYSPQDLSAALEPLASIIRKCEKARSKYEPTSVQYRRFHGTIRAMELSRQLIENELGRK